MAYETTTVPVERSQGELRALLTDYRASRFGFGEETDSAVQTGAAATSTGEVAADYCPECCPPAVREWAS